MVSQREFDSLDCRDCCSDRTDGSFVVVLHVGVRTAGASHKLAAADPARKTGSNRGIHPCLRAARQVFFNKGSLFVFPVRIDGLQRHPEAELHQELY